MLNNFIGGGQVFLHKIRMFSQVFFRTMNVSLIVGIIVAGCTYYNSLTKLDWDAFISYRKAVLALDFDERDPAVLNLIEKAIRACQAKGKYVGICGQGPSDHPDFAKWLLDKGIASMSLNPDTVISTWEALSK